MNHIDFETALGVSRDLLGCADYAIDQDERKRREDDAFMLAVILNRNVERKALPPRWCRFQKKWASFVEVFRTKSPSHVQKATHVKETLLHRCYEISDGIVKSSIIDAAGAALQYMVVCHLLADVLHRFVPQSDPVYEDIVNQLDHALKQTKPETPVVRPFN